MRIEGILPIGGHSPPYAAPWLNPIVAKDGWLQSRGIKGEAVVIYRNPLITMDLESSGFPVG